MLQHLKGYHKSITLIKTGRLKQNNTIDLRSRSQCCDFVSIRLSQDRGSQSNLPSDTMKLNLLRHCSSCQLVGLHFERNS